MQTEVIVTHRVPGFHYWPGAPEEVSYLAHRHRHMFMIIAAWRVSHDNRDIEFHTAQGWIRALYDDVHDFGPKSCEMIAKDLRAHLLGDNLPSPTWIEVWEDEENGARVEF